VHPRPGEYALHHDDIFAALEKDGSSIALVLFSGVQYYTGQWFPMRDITARARALGCIVGWDLAHAVGNVPMSLHDWGVDFAVWCTYKYLNSGPGGIGGLFVHERWDAQEPRFAGWWGHTISSRFAMPPKFERTQGALGYQQSNPSVLDIASLLGSLSALRDAGSLPAVRARSVALTSLLLSLLKSSPFFVPLSECGDAFPCTTKEKPTGFTIITPEEEDRHGAQLSLLFLPIGGGVMQKVFARLKEEGVIGDEREPDVIRLAPAPLYNTDADCRKVVEVIQRAFEDITSAK
jgi:kynureninase